MTVDIDLDSTEQTPVQIGNEAVFMAAEGMRPRMDLYREIIDAYNARGYVDDADHIQVKLNRLIELIKRNAAENTQALFPQRPYINFKAKRKDPLSVRRARNKVAVIDGQMDRAKFFEKAVLCTMYGEGFGNAALEPGWDVWVESITQKNIEIDPVTQQVVDMIEETWEQVSDALRYKVFQPWQCYWHPVGRTPLEKPFLVLKEVIPRQEAERLIDEKIWRPPKGVSATEFKERLKAGPVRGPGLDWNAQWNDDLSNFHKDIRSRGDVVIMCRLYSRNRWITWLNYDMDVRVQENGWTNMDHRTKPVAWMTVNPDVGQTSFYGKSVWEEVRDLATLEDDVFSLVLDTQLTNNLRWYVYDRKHIDPEDLQQSHGGQIELRRGDELQGNSLDRALRVLDPPTVETGLMDMAGIFGDRQYARTNRPDVTRGIAPSPKQTARATETLKEQAQIPHQVGARYVENTFMPQLADLTIAQCDAHMTMVQMMDSGGLDVQEAIEVVSPDPADIPGGFEYDFEGSDRAFRRAERVEKRKEFWNFAGKHPLIANGPGAAVIIRKMAEDAEFDEDEIDEMLQQMPSAAPVAPDQAAAQGMGTVGSESAIAAPGEIATPAQNAQVAA